MKKWMRKEKTSKREQEIVTPKMPKRDTSFTGVERLAFSMLLTGAVRRFSRWQKRFYAYVQMDRDQKATVKEIWNYDR